MKRIIIAIFCICGILAAQQANELKLGSGVANDNAPKKAGDSRIDFVAMRRCYIF